MRLDCHQHFWAYDERQYPWIPRDSPLHRDWLPSDLEPLLAAAGFAGSIAVQARQTLEESHWLLTLADHFPFIKGVVGWVDLRDDRVEEQLAVLAPHPRFVGVRHVLQDESDDRFMLERNFQRGIGKLAQFKLTYDLLIYPKQLAAAIELVRNFPHQLFVLDHIAKPPIKAGALSPWREHIRELATAPNVFCKLSGMVTEARHPGWKPDDFRPFMEVVFEAFAPARLMFGSDWPVCLLAASYTEVFRLVQGYIAHLPGPLREAIWGDTAADFYLRNRARSAL
jgi:L-fuconolactonase